MCDKLSSKEKKIVKSLSDGTAANNNQTVKYNSTTKKFEFTNAGGGGDVYLAGENQVFQNPIYVGAEANINNELFTRQQVYDQFSSYDTSIQAALNTKANTSELANYATTTALTNGLASKVDTATLANYATTTALTNGLASKVDTATLANYATTTALTNGLAGKVDTATLANYAAKATTNTFTMLQTFTRAIANSSGTNANFGININYSVNNTGGTNTMTGVFVNATETALIGTTHNLIDLQVASSSKFSVRNDGYLLTSSAVQAATFLQGNALRFTGLGRIQPASDGVFTFSNSAVTSFDRMQLGGTTNAFPAIKRNSAAIDFRLADDSGFATIQANAIVANSLIRCASSTTSAASLSIPAGTAPTTPIDGDIWNGGDGNLYMRIGGTTKRFTMS